MELVVLVVLPTVLFYVAVRAPDAWRWYADRQERRRQMFARQVLPPDRSLQQLASDLRRIATELDRVASDPRLPGRITRMKAVSAAYDDTLLIACRVLGVEASQERAPLSSSERLVTEAELAQAGLDW